MTESSGEDRVGTSSRPPLWGLLVAILVGVLVLSAGAIWLYRTTESLASTWEVTLPEFMDNADSGSASSDESQDAPESPAIVLDQTAPVELQAGPLQAWSGQERVNFLLLGIDQRCDESGPTHTDTMMVASVDPVTMSAVALSLPRDLWTEIPNFGLDRINQAHFYGESSSYPGGGPALAMETVEGLLGIPIHYYGAVNFDAFIEFVDLIGGIDVEVAEDIDDQKYPDRCYGYEPFRIAAGTHHLDGAQALKYARTRATLGGDVDRAGRQQQVMMAVRDAILSLDMIPRLMAQAPQLWQSFQDNARTNMNLDEAIQLALLTKEIPQENIRLEVIDYGYLYPETRANGQQVLSPNRELIRELRDELFAPDTIPAPDATLLPERIAEENARVVILNGTPVFGLAATTEEFLRQYSINVTEIGNADSAAYPTTRIYDYSASHETANYLAQLLEVPPLNHIYSPNPAGDYDILIVLGNDSQLLPPTSTPAP